MCKLLILSIDFGSGNLILAFLVFQIVNKHATQIVVIFNFKHFFHVRK